jgi:hypothetical protein
VLHIQFPADFAQALKRVGSFVDVFKLFFSPACNGFGEFPDRWLMNVVLLPAAMTALAIGYFLLEHRRPAARDHLASNLLFIIFFCFPSVINTAFNAFNCLDVKNAALSKYNGRSVLMADDRMYCDDLGLLQPLSGFVIVVFGCGIPVAFAAVLVIKSRTYDRTPEGTNAAAVAKRVSEKFHVDISQAEYVVRDIAIGSKYSFLMDA